MADFSSVDWMILVIVLTGALAGWERGFLLGLISLGVGLGAALAAVRLAPYILGSESLWVPLSALVGVVALIGAVNALVAWAHRSATRRLRFSDSPSYRMANGLGGAALGGAVSIFLIWMLSAVVLASGQPEGRLYVQRSTVLRHLNDALPPATLLSVLRHFDPLPQIAGPAISLAPPDATLPSRPGVQRAAASVVRVSGEACGLLTSGSGWVISRGWVVTNAHVVAGHDGTTVSLADGAEYESELYGFDSHDDVALLRVPGLPAEPLVVVDAGQGEAAAVLGYPGGGPFDAQPARVGRPRLALSQNVYGHPTSRRLVPISALVRPGNSGGPVVDAKGRVLATVFGSRPGQQGGYGVPTDEAENLLKEVSAPVEPGPCLGH